MDAFKGVNKKMEEIIMRKKEMTEVTEKECPECGEKFTEKIESVIMNANVVSVDMNNKDSVSIPYNRI